MRLHNHGYRIAGSLAGTVSLIVAFSGCTIFKTLAERCEHSIGLTYANSMEPQTPLVFSIGVGPLTINDLYGQPFLVINGPGGELIPRKDYCWLSSLDAMATDLMGAYFLDRSNGNRRAASGRDSAYPDYTVSGRILELSASTGGVVRLRAHIQVVRGDPNGRNGVVILNRSFTVSNDINGVPLNTGGAVENVHIEFSKAVISLAHDVAEAIKEY